jgi:hypothetical protein
MLVIFFRWGPVFLLELVDHEVHDALELGRCRLVGVRSSQDDEHRGEVHFDPGFCC